MKETLGAAAVEVAEQVWASVVQVSTNGHGAGAGTIWRSDGVVVTNHHVAPGETATVTLADTRSYPARAIARDPANDLAVLKIDARDLPAVAVGDARALRPGEIVLAVGHPFGVKNAVTVGLVTEALRRGERGRELIQADVLLTLGGERLGGPDELAGALAGALAGPIRLSLLRGGQPLEVIVLPERPASRAA